MRIGKALLWDELATLYDKSNSGRPARTLPMDQVFQWVEGQKDKFYTDPKEGTIHKILTGGTVMDLSSIESGKKPMPRRTIIYGVHGIGKSTFCASAPKPIFIQTEDGLGDIDCAKFPLCSTFDDVMNCLRTLFAEEHAYKTIVIDSADWLEKAIWKEVCANYDPKGKKGGHVGNIEEIGYAKGYQFSVPYWEKILLALNHLRAKRGILSIFTSHAKIEKIENPEGENFHRYSPDLNKHVGSVLMEWSDEILFANYDVRIAVTEEEFGTKKKRAVGEGERFLHTQERPSYLAKNRLAMPLKIPFSWKDYAGYFNESKKAKTKAKPKANGKGKE